MLERKEDQVLSCLEMGCRPVCGALFQQLPESQQFFLPEWPATGAPLEEPLEPIAVPVAPPMRLFGCGFPRLRLLRSLGFGESHYLLSLSGSFPTVTPRLQLQQSCSVIQRSSSIGDIIRHCHVVLIFFDIARLSDSNPLQPEPG